MARRQPGAAITPTTSINRGRRRIQRSAASAGSAPSPAASRCATSAPNPALQRCPPLTTTISPPRAHARLRRATLCVFIDDSSVLMDGCGVPAARRSAPVLVVAGPTTRWDMRVVQGAGNVRSLGVDRAKRWRRATPWSRRRPALVKHRARANCCKSTADSCVTRSAARMAQRPTLAGADHTIAGCWSPRRAPRLGTAFEGSDAAAGCAWSA
jgi:hypothetical protein